MKKIKTTDIEKTLKHTSKDDLNSLLDSFEENEFVLEFNRLLTERNMSKSDLIRKTTLDRNYAYQILQGQKIGSKDKIIQFCLALSCTLEEANRLLKLSNHSPLYAKRKRDTVLILAFNKQLDVMETNELLSHYAFDVL